MFLWKNIAALPFMILGFLFFMEKRWWPFALASAAVFLTHRTTAVFYSLTIGCSLVYWQIRHKKFWWLAGELVAAGAVTFALFPHIRATIDQLINNNNYYVRTGLFLEGQNILLLLWPVILLALPGIWWHIRRRQHSLPIIFLAVSLLWFALKLPFYRRVLIYLDLGLICFAASFLGDVALRTTKLKIAAGIVMVFLIYTATGFAWAKYPLISPTEVEELRHFSGGGFILAVSANDAPWLAGYVSHARLGAPGLLEDPHTYQEWLDFWQGRHQLHFISEYPRPLFFYERSYRLQGPLTKCLRQVSDNFFRYDFSCNPQTD